MLKKQQPLRIRQVLLDGWAPDTQQNLNFTRRILIQ